MVTISRGDVVLCDLNPVLGTEQGDEGAVYDTVQ